MEQKYTYCLSCDRRLLPILYCIAGYGQMECAHVRSNGHPCYSNQHWRLGYSSRQDREQNFEAFLASLDE